MREPLEMITVSPHGGAIVLGPKCACIHSHVNAVSAPCDADTAARSHGATPAPPQRKIHACQYQYRQRQHQYQYQ